MNGTTRRGCLGRTQGGGAVAVLAVAALVFGCLDPIGFNNTGSSGAGTVNPDYNGHVVVWNMTGSIIASSESKLGEGKTVKVTFVPTDGTGGEVAWDDAVAPGAKTVSQAVPIGGYEARVTDAESGDVIATVPVRVQPESTVHEIQYVYFYNLTIDGFAVDTDLQSILAQAQLLNLVNDVVLNGGGGGSLADIAALLQSENSSGVPASLADYLRDLVEATKDLGDAEGNEAVAALRDALEAALVGDTNSLLSALNALSTTDAEGETIGLAAILQKFAEDSSSYYEKMAEVTLLGSDETVLILRNLTLQDSKPATVTRVSIAEGHEDNVLGGTEVGPNDEFGTVLSQEEMPATGTREIYVYYQKHDAYGRPDGVERTVSIKKILKKKETNILYFYYSNLGEFEVSGDSSGPSNIEDSASWYQGSIELVNNGARNTVTGVYSKRSSTSKWDRLDDFKTVKIAPGGNSYTLNNLASGQYDIMVWVNGAAPDDVSSNEAYVFEGVQVKLDGSGRAVYTDNVKGTGTVIIKNLVSKEVRITVGATGDYSVQSGEEWQYEVTAGIAAVKVSTMEGALDLNTEEGLETVDIYVTPGQQAYYYLYKNRADTDGPPYQLAEYVDQAAVDVDGGSNLPTGDGTIVIETVTGYVARWVKDITVKRGYETIYYNAATLAHWSQTDRIVLNVPLGEGYQVILNDSGVIKGSDRFTIAIGDLYKRVRVAGGTSANPTVLTIHSNQKDVAKVTDYDLQFIPIPVAGAAPMIEFERDQYTGTVWWDPDPDAETGSGVFEAGQVYTATVFLYANEGWTFTGVPENIFAHAKAANRTDAVQNAAGDPDDGSIMIVTIEFKATQGGAAATVTDTDLTAKVIAPEYGVTPVTDGFETDEYIGSVSWVTPPPDLTVVTAAFEANTVYQAWVQLRAKSGYSLINLSESAFTYTGADSVVFNSGSGLVTITFKPTGTTALTTVNQFNLTQLVESPETGKQLKAVTLETAQYTGTVTYWAMPGDETADPVELETFDFFAADTVYQAVVTLTPKTGYTFTGVPADGFTYTGATSCTNLKHRGVVTITFPVTEPEAEP